MTLKKQLRQDFKTRLAAIPADTARLRSQEIAERLLNLPEMQTARRIFTCLSFGLEVDTWPLVDTLHAEGREIFVPRSVPGTRKIVVHPYPCELKTLRFGLRQPKAKQPILPDEEVGTIDVALILGLAFDRDGYRLGYGGGYFDTFFARHALFSVGLAFDEQITDEVPREKHDLPMRTVITPSSVYVAPSQESSL